MAAEVINIPPPSQHVYHTPKAPPMYHGKCHEDTKLFLEKFKIYSKLHDIKDIDDIRTHLGQYLSGDAFVWWCNHKDKEYASPQDLYGAFMSTFNRETPKHHRLSEVQNRQYQTSDTPQTYLDSIQKLCTEAEYSEEQTITAFLLGLPVQIQGLMANLAPKSLSAAYTALCNFISLLPEAFKSEGKGQQTSSVSDEELKSIDNKLECLEEKLDKLHSDTKLQDGSHQEDTHEDTGKQSYLSYNDTPDESLMQMTQNCNKKLQSRKRNRPRVTCYFCGRVGHKQRFCYSRLKLMQENNSVRCRNTDQENCLACP